MITSAALSAQRQELEHQAEILKRKKNKDTALQSTAVPERPSIPPQLTPTPSPPSYQAARDAFASLGSVSQPFGAGKPDDEYAKDDDFDDKDDLADNDLGKSFRESRRYHDWPEGSNGPKTDEDRCIHDEQDAEAAGLHDGIKEDKGMAAAAKSKRILPGDADSPGRDIPVRRPSHLPETLGGNTSRQQVGGVSFDHVNCQALGPVRLAEVRTAGHNSSGSSIHDNQGSATVARLDNRVVAANGLIPGSPSGKPGQRAFAPAPSGYGSRSGTTPKRLGRLPYLSGPGS